MAKAAQSKRNQRFSIQAPAAISVQLVGDFTDWQKQPIHLHKGDHDVWSTEVPLKPGVYHYRFMVDGTWRDDPECTLRVENPFGSTNAVREVV
jgi:1,4-alpha-glucan branching enzyme